MDREKSASRTEGERLDRLEARLAELEDEVEELCVIRHIEDLMHRYACFCGAGLGERIADELWSGRDDVSIEYGASGMYEKPWRVRAFYTKEKIPGMLSTLSLSTPCVTVAADRESAKGIWTAFATETDAGDLGVRPPEEADSRRMLLSSETGDGKKYRAEVLLQKYEVDFVREEGDWKILHLHVIEYFRCPYDKDWVRFAAERFETDGMWLESLFETPMELPPEAHGENLPSGPSTKHWQYAADRLPELIPDPEGDTSE